MSASKSESSAVLKDSQGVLTPAARTELETQTGGAKTETSLLNGSYDNLRQFLVPPAPNVRELSAAVEKAFRAAWSIASAITSPGQSLKRLLRTKDAGRWLEIFESRFLRPADHLEKALDTRWRLTRPTAVGKLAAELKEHPEAVEWIELHYDSNLCDRKPEHIFTRDLQTARLGNESFANAHLAALDFACAVATECPGVKPDLRAPVRELRQLWRNLNEPLEREAKVSTITSQQYSEILARLQIEREFAERLASSVKQADAAEPADGGHAVTPRDTPPGDKAGTPAALPVQYVTLDQMAALVSRSKKTLERKVNKNNGGAPVPDVEGGGGKPHEWIWANIRPWLETSFNRTLPERFPQ